MNKYSKDFDKIKCINCGSKRIEKYVRAIIYPNDPLLCSDCKTLFQAEQIKELNWIGEHKKMNEVEQVLVFPEEVFHEIGFFTGISREGAKYLENTILLNSLRYMSRPEAEVNPKFKQLIPYTIITSDALPNTFFVYKRTKKSGESRLHDKYSIGVGGHINPCDGEPSSAYHAAFLRELQEEISLSGSYTEEVRGVIYDDSNDVGKVHFGVIHFLNMSKEGELKFTDPAVDPQNSWFWKKEYLYQNLNSFETWSQLVIKEFISS